MILKLLKMDLVLLIIRMSFFTINTYFYLWILGFLLVIFLTSFLTCLWDWRDLWTCNYDNFFSFFFFSTFCSNVLQTALALGNILPRSVWLFEPKAATQMCTRLTPCHNLGFVFKWNTHILGKGWEKWG